MELITTEATSIAVAILQLHLTMKALVCFPDALELRAIAPSHLAITVAATCLEIALVLSLFKLTTPAAWQTVVILDLTIAIGATIFEHSAEFVTILVINLGEPDNFKQKLDIYDNLPEEAAIKE